MSETPITPDDPDIPDEPPPAEDGSPEVDDQPLGPPAELTRGGRAAARPPRARAAGGGLATATPGTPL